MQPQPWTERVLAFGRPAGELPLLLERLLGTPARIRGMAMQVPLEVLNLRRSGSWSVLEHIAHLLVLQDQMERRLVDHLERRTHLCTIDLSGQEARLHRERGRELGDLLEEFRLKRRWFVERIDEMDDGQLAHRALHPCTGELRSVVDMAFYMAEHDDHHLAVMRRLIEQRRPTISC